MYKCIVVNSDKRHCHQSELLELSIIQWNRMSKMTKLMLFVVKKKVMYWKQLLTKNNITQKHCPTIYKHRLYHETVYTTFIHSSVNSETLLGLKPKRIVSWATSHESQYADAATDHPRSAVRSSFVHAARTRRVHMFVTVTLLIHVLCWSKSVISAWIVINDQHDITIIIDWPTYI